MATVSNATPLIALDAVVIDTETTGLDPAQGAHRRNRRAAAQSRQARREIRAAPAGQSGRADPRRRRPQIHHIDDATVAVGAALCRRLAGILRRDLRLDPDRARARLRSRRAQARMRARRPAVAAAAHARHQAAGGGGRAPSRRLHARASGELARRDGRGPPFGARRCHADRADLPRAAAQAARRQYPHLGRSRAGLPRAHRRARGSASRRLGGSGGGAARARGARARAHRSLSLSPSRRRRDERAAEIHRRRCLARRCAAAHGAGEDFLAAGGAGRRRRRHARARHRHRHRARRAARAERAGRSRRWRGRSATSPASR